MNVLFKPIWFDSMGAKSSSTLIKTDIKIVIDPGIAIMHQSFPASKEMKIKWKEEGKKRIIKECKNANVIIISHYHHDHYIRDDLSIYYNKLLFMKDPNEYINESQRSRAEKFFRELLQRFKINFEEVLSKNKEKKYSLPLNELKIALKRDYGDYAERKKEIIENGIKWFEKQTMKWKMYEKLPELKINGTEIKFPEGKKFRIGETELRFTKPLFHGIEFSKVGWVFATIIEYKGKKIIHTSDINGPIIEDYAEWIIKEKPDILILDGPPTYMLGYMLNKINLNRAIENAIKIIDESEAKLIIYDHHLPRERKFREHTMQVWKFAKKKRVNLMTASEYIGKKPVVEI